MTVIHEEKKFKSTALIKCFCFSSYKRGSSEVVSYTVVYTESVLELYVFLENHRIEY